MIDNITSRQPAQSLDSKEKPLKINARRLAVAPMVDWTDRHCRFFHRLLSKRSWLYTAMVTTGALTHGDVPRHLDYNAEEHPVALQLGGSEPADLAKAARIGERWCYDEINLNCGCPSERVQRGVFGACLMAEPDLVADCVKAMRDAVDLPVTVKHRIGIDAIEDYGFVRDFVGKVAQAGCTTFIAHARKAVLKGLSPKQNREIPPLKYDYVLRLKHDFPQLEILINGGVADWPMAMSLLEKLDGVMVGRHAYHQPYWLAHADANAYGEGSVEDAPSAEQVEAAMMEYAIAQVEKGTYLGAVTRHMLGLHHAKPGARLWRRMMSDPKLLGAARDAAGVRTVFEQAASCLAVPAVEAVQD